MILTFMCALSDPANATGTWTRLTRSAPGTVQVMLLLTDGTVMCGNGGGNSWYRLTPDVHGSYVNGTWTTLASMNDTRLYFSSDVLLDGRVFVAGGEYGTGTNTAEVYDPSSNTWTQCPPPPAGQRLFYDSVSKLLPNGNVLIAPVEAATYGGTVIYNSASNTWTVGPNLFRGGYQDEASWVKLADDSILTIDPFGINSERYIPSLNQWVNDSDVPVSLYDAFGFELGAAFLLPNGNAIFFGATGHNAIYTPSGNANPGTWTAAPDFPNGQGTPDAAAAMMVNSKILCAASPVPISANHFPTPTSFYEYDYVSNTFTQVGAPGGGTTLNQSTYITCMLDLPDGSVLYSQFSSRLYDYKPDGSALAAAKPAILSISRNNDGSFHLVGTQLNGISEGAAYGDDNQMDSNYPLLRLTNSSGSVYYCRTYNWSRSSVMTGSTPLSVELTLPPALPAGVYSMAAVANGISSDSLVFSTIPPFITSAAQNQTVFQGDASTFSMTVVGAINYQWQFNGAPLASATNATLILTNVDPSQAGAYTLVVSNLFGSTNSVTNLLAVIPTVPLPVALDASNLVWTTAGSSGSFPAWHGLTNVTHDGVAAGQSGPIGDGLFTSVGTSVTGPQTLTFWWKVSSQPNSDVLTFYVNGTAQASISGEVDWQQFTYYLPAGTETLQWTYAKDASGNAGQDAGWLDQVTLAPGGSPPFIVQQPDGQSVTRGSSFDANVNAGGTPVLEYQWLFNGAPILNATNSILHISNVADSNSGQYSVIVSNTFGWAPSSNATLSVVFLAAIGDNTFGQCNLPSTLTNVVAISCGDYHNLALHNDGTVTAWGDGFNGQCDVPSGLSNVVAIAAGSYHSLALLDDGSVVGWGDDSSGQIDMPLMARNVIAIAAGGSLSLALHSDGTLTAWGDDSWSETNVPVDLTNVIAVAVGGQHALALIYTDLIIAWGSDLGPSAGYGGQIDVPQNSTPSLAISAGGYHSLAVKLDGTVVGWGDDSLGQVSTPAGLSNVIAVAAGGGHSLALNKDGTEVAWGDNSYGQISNVTNYTDVIAIAAGEYHSLTLFGSAPLPLQLMTPVITGGVLSIPLPTERGKTYFLEAEDNPLTSHWSIISAIAGNGSVKTLTDHVPNPGSRYYRVRRQ